jgi:hypothetical protein
MSTFRLDGFAAHTEEFATHFIREVVSTVRQRQTRLRQRQTRLQNRQTQAANLANAEGEQQRGIAGGAIQQRRPRRIRIQERREPTEEGSEGTAPPAAEEDQA